jgi:hypothetical protein
MTEEHKRIVARAGITAFSSALLLAHVRHWIMMDATALGLAGLAILPWLTAVIESASLPGGWKVNFREVKRKQLRQQEEIDALKFLVANFVSTWELEHLRKLTSGDPFPYEALESFKSELRRLRDFGLVEELPGTNIDLLFYTGSDARDFVRITQRGRDYLEHREAATLKSDRSHTA